MLYIGVLLLTACGGGDEPGGDNPVVSKDFINVTPSLSLLGDGQNTELNISANCRWSISYSADWLTVTPMAGTNNETVKVSAGKNATKTVRSVTLTIQGGNAPAKSVTVTQGAGSYLSVSTNTLDFEAKSETKSFTINSNANWQIDKPEWCTLSATSGKGDLRVNVTAQDNPVKEQRTGQIIVSGTGFESVTITLTQKPKDTTNTQEPGKGDNPPPGY